MNRLIRTVAASAIALWSATAAAGNGGPKAGEPPSAQPVQPPQQPGTASPPAAPPVQSQGTPALVLDTQDYEGLLGKGVRAVNGEDLGRIIDVIIDKDGRPRAAIIDFGGFLGVGSRKIAVDWRVLNFAADGKPGRITLMLSRNQVRVSPEYKPGDPIVVLGASSPGGPPLDADLPQPPTTQEKPADKPAEKPADKQPEKTPER